MNYTFLLIGERAEAQWSLVLESALSPLGDLHIVPETSALQAVSQGNYAVIIVDAGAVCDANELTAQLLAQRPGVCVVIATASPTWQRARQALRAGAADYIRKTLDERELRTKIEAVLRVLPPSAAL